MSPDDDEPSWHDEQPVIVAAGVAGLLLLALLVWAVIRTADNSSGPPDPVEFPTSSVTSSTYTTESTSSTSYAVPSVQTSQGNPALTRPPESTAPDDGPTDDETTTSTTTTNPYLTTTPTNAGHI